MFFKRTQTKAPSFDERIGQLQSEGYTVSRQPSGKVRVSRNDLAVLLEPGPGGEARVAGSGILLGGELALLTDLGFQKIFRTATGPAAPALAEHLHALHDFEEDLRAALDIPSYFNEGLGTTNEQHLYDRVKDRDAGPPPRPWQKQ
jgi:hypothetical protein